MARIFQDSREKSELGAKAPWYVEWRVNGRRRSQKVGKRSDAKKVAALRESEELHRRNGIPFEKPWIDFRQEYETNILPTMLSVRSREKSLQVLARFEKMMKPRFVSLIDRQCLDSYVARRLQQPGKIKGDKVSPATVQSEMATLRAALGYAVEYGYLQAVPKMPKLKAHQSQKRFVSADHFNAIMEACCQAAKPAPAYHRGQPYSPGEWWQGLLATMWATGQRIGALLAIRWDDVDLDRGVIVSRAKTNKGKRDSSHDIPPSVIELLKPLRGFDPRLFPWNHHRRTLDVELHAIQRAAEIHLPCPGDHEHCDSCHFYGFHDVRRSHATYNYGRVDDRDLQRQMGHRSFDTTKRYIMLAQENQRRAYDAFLPESLTKKAAAE